MSRVNLSEVKSAFRRATLRSASHILRAWVSAVSIGPGRIPGQVLAVDVLPDTVLIRGWAALPHKTIRAVVVTIDGEVFGQAKGGLPTPSDAAGSSVTSWSPSAGWEIELDRRFIGKLRFRVGAVALLSGGLTEDILGDVSVVLPAPQQIGVIDLPAPDAVVGDTVINMSGWFRTSLGYDRLEIHINGTFFVRARLLSVARPDLEAFLTDSDAPLAGWEAIVELKGAPGREFVVTAEAVGDAGRTTIGQRRFLLSEPSGDAIVEMDRLALLQRRSAVIAGRERAMASTPHLLIATHHLGLGGGQLYLQEVLKVILADGSVRCTVLSMQDGVLRDELEQLGAEVQIIGYTPTSSLQFEQWMYQLVATVSLTGANIVVANTLGSFWGVELAARLSLPSIWAIHESFSPEVFMRIGFAGQPDAGVRASFLRAFGRVDDAVFEADATRAMFDHVIRPDRGLRIDYGIDLEQIEKSVATINRSDAREMLALAADEVVILCIGTYEPRKAQGLLALAFSHVSSEFPNAVLAMVGDLDGPFSQGVHRLVDKLNSGPSIRLVPMTSNIDEWYISSDAFILASDIESLPRSMLEAMAFGLPVLGTKVFGIPELISDGVTGLLFKPSSVKETEDVLRRFLSLSSLDRQGMGEAGKASVWSTRSSTEYAREYRMLIDALLLDSSALPNAALNRL